MKNIIATIYLLLGVAGFMTGESKDFVLISVCTAAILSFIPPKQK